MTWSNRFRMFFGLILVVAVVGALTIVFSQRKGETLSSSATITAMSYPVGTDYPGTVIEQSVAPGDEVVVGTPIVTIQSNTLLDALNEGQTVESSEVYDVHKDGTLTVKSTVNGIVESVVVQQGGYASAGSTIAEISETEALYVTAEFLLDPKDFARVEQGAIVKLQLPNSETVSGNVDSFEVTTVDGEAQTIVKIVSDQLGFGSNGGLVAPGTPIVAEMKLRNDDVLARGIDAFRDFVRDLVEAFTE